MSTRARRKLMKEQKKLLEAMSEDLNFIGVAAKPKSPSNIFKWDAVIVGAEGTPFEDAWFPLQFEFNESYPLKPPKVKFLVPVYHPNVYKNGAICLDILAEKWSPVYQITTILMSIRSLLDDPNVMSPANVDASADFTKNKELYINNVRKSILKNKLLHNPPAWYEELRKSLKQLK